MPSGLEKFISEAKLDGGFVVVVVVVVAVVVVVVVVGPTTSSTAILGEDNSSVGEGGGLPASSVPSSSKVAGVQGTSRGASTDGNPPSHLK